MNVQMYENILELKYLFVTLLFKLSKAYVPGPFTAAMFEAQCKRICLRLPWIFFVLFLFLAACQYIPTNLLRGPLQNAKDSFNLAVKSIQQIKPTCPPVQLYPVDSPPDSQYGKPVANAKNVLFHSVPKCGSRTLVWVMWDLQRQEKISTEPQYIPYLLRPAPVEERHKQMTDYLHTAKEPTFFHGHIRYVDIYGEERPVYASMLREPYSRYVSWYYFMRHGDADISKEELRKNLGPSAARPNETLDDCFRLNRHDCQEPSYYQLNVNIFCGHHAKCDQDPAYALQQAKINLEKFLVVGIVEEYEDTVKVLEKLMPSMFDNGFETYKDMLVDNSNMSKTYFKKKPSRKIEKYLKEKLKYDIEFYKYAKEKFHKLKERLRIGGNSTC